MKGTMTNLIDQINRDDRLREVVITDEHAQSFPTTAVAPVLATEGILTVTTGPGTATSLTAVTIA
jgi:hypothetical protein